ncbi:MAG: phage portal protein [Gemmataceae bacterium]|nr:phage portal protein [Gemmataceae bacterium]
MNAGRAAWRQPGDTSEGLLLRRGPAPFAQPRTGSISTTALAMKYFLHRLARWLARKTAPPLAPDPGLWPVDAYRRLRPPSPSDLLAELKGTAWACASINAAVCAAAPPRLFVRTRPGEPDPRCRTRPIDPGLTQRLIPTAVTSLRQQAATIEEVVEHPLLTLLAQVNPVHNQFDLWELTQLYLEVHGSAYWLLDVDPVIRVPTAIWILPAHQVAPRRAADSPRLVDAYEFRGRVVQHFPPERIIHFRMPDPRDPYCAGLSPLRACFEQVALASEYAAMKRSVYDNAALPSVVLTPEDGIGREESDRLERQWQRKFERGGRGRLFVAESRMQVTLLSQSMGDLAALADMRATKEDIANAFQVPLPFLSGDTNLANMQAADHLHKTLAILPRLRRRDEKLNEQLVPWFDPSGRLFFASPDPTPANQHFVLAQEQADLRHGVRTINEVRAARGLPPVPWGDQPRNT